MMRDFIFNRVSVKWRLISGIVILLIFMVAAGTGGLLGMNRINSSFSDVYEKNIIPLERLREAYDLFAIDLIKTVDQLLYQQIDWEKGLTDIEAVKRKINNHWATILEIRDRSFLDKNDDWLNEARPMVEDTSSAMGELISVIKQKNIDQLDDLQDKKLAPLALEYRDKIDHLIKDRMEAAKNRYEQAQKEYRLESPRHHFKGQRGERRYRIGQVR